MTAARPSMRSLVSRLCAACEEWLVADGLPSPPATAELLRETDAAMAACVRSLLTHYPAQMSRGLQGLAEDMARSQTMGDAE